MADVTVQKRSEEDIDKVINENTTIIIPEELLTKLLRKGINKNAIPIHYGSVVGTEQDAIDFVRLLHPEIKGINLMKQ